MKRFFFLATAFVLGFSAMAQEKADDVIKVSSEKHDFGKIKQGVPVTTYFTLTNSTDKPVVIENAWAGCGCTTPDQPKEPIAPGAEGTIKARFNSTNFSGHVTKEVYVEANNSNRNNESDNKLTFTADIK